MKYRNLGKTDITVSEIGFGAWGIGGGAYGPIDDKTSESTINEALACGVTFFDTASLYGDGHSEYILGRVLKRVRGDVVIATKAGTLPHTGFTMPQDFSYEHIMDSVEGSLRRLNTDYIDLLQLHSPSLDALEGGEAIQALKELKLQGRIREYGISVRSPIDGVTAILKYGFPAVQVNFNLIDHRAADCGLFDLAFLLGVGIIVRTPLCFGYLTGALQNDEKFSPSDHRCNWPEDQIQRWVSAPQVFASLSQNRGCTPSQFALRFCLDTVGISTVIPGMRR